MLWGRLQLGSPAHVGRRRVLICVRSPAPRSPTAMPVQLHTVTSIGFLLAAGVASGTCATDGGYSRRPAYSGGERARRQRHAAPAAPTHLQLRHAWRPQHELGIRAGGQVGSLQQRLGHDRLLHQAQLGLLPLRQEATTALLDDHPVAVEQQACCSGCGAGASGAVVQPQR